MNVKIGHSRAKNCLLIFQGGGANKHNDAPKKRVKASSQSVPLFYQQLALTVATQK